MLAEPKNLPRVVALKAVLLAMSEHRISPYARAVIEHPGAMEELRQWCHGTAIDLGYGEDFDAMEHSENKVAYRRVVSFLWPLRLRIAAVVAELQIKHGLA